MPRKLRIEFYMIIFIFCNLFRQPNSPLVRTLYVDVHRYESQFENLDKSGGDVRIFGFFQSYKYFKNVRPCIHREFTFLPEFQTVADNFLRDVADQYQYVQSYNVTRPWVNREILNVIADVHVLLFLMGQCRLAWTGHCHCAIVPLCHGTGAPFDEHRRPYLYSKFIFGYGNANFIEINHKNVTFYF